MIIVMIIITIVMIMIAIIIAIIIIIIRIETVRMITLKRNILPALPNLIQLLTHNSNSPTQRLQPSSHLLFHILYTILQFP